MVVDGGLDLVLIVGGERKIRCKCERPRKKRKMTFQNAMLVLFVS